MNVAWILITVVVAACATYFLPSIFAFEGPQGVAVDGAAGKTSVDERTVTTSITQSIAARGTGGSRVLAGLYSVVGAVFVVASPLLHALLCAHAVDGSSSTGSTVSRDLLVAAGVLCIAYGHTEFVLPLPGDSHAIVHSKRHAALANTLLGPGFIGTAAAGILLTPAFQAPAHGLAIAAAAMHVAFQLLRLVGVHFNRRKGSSSSSSSLSVVASRVLGAAVVACELGAVLAAAAAYATGCLMLATPTTCRACLTPQLS